MASEKKIPLRSEVAKENTWALEDLYANDDAWKADYESVKALLPTIEGYKGKLGTSGKELLSFLKLQDELELKLDSIANYAMRKSDEDTKNTTYQAIKAQTSSLFVAISGAAAYVEPEILQISDETLDKFYKEEPALLVYKRWIDKIRKQKDHILSEAEEKIMAAASEMAQAPGEVYGLLNNAI